MSDRNEIAQPEERAAKARLRAGIGSAVSSVETAKRLILQDHPHFRGLEVTFFNEGWDFRMFQLGNRWLFRFPKHEKGAAKLAMERELLAHLAPSLSLPIPGYGYYNPGESCGRFPFAGYRKIPGTPADVATTIDYPVAATQLTQFLGELHAFPVQLARQAGVRAGKGVATVWRDRAFAGLPALAAIGVAPGTARTYLQHNTPGWYRGEPRLVHNDLWSEHVLIEQASGRVSGVIDWGDTMLGDPAVDFAGLYTWFGEAYFDHLVETYTREKDDAFASRARYLACCMAIHNVALGREMGRPGWVRAGRRVLGWILAN